MRTYTRMQVHKSIYTQDIESTNSRYNSALCIDFLQNIEILYIQCISTYTYQQYIRFVFHYLLHFLNFICANSLCRLYMYSGASRPPLTRKNACFLWHSYLNTKSALMSVYECRVSDIIWDKIFVCMHLVSFSFQYNAGCKIQSVFKIKV